MAAKLELVRAEYQGTEIQFNEQGWFNATQAAERFGKRPNDWLNLDSTKEYLAAFERKYGLKPYLKTRKGGNKREGTNTRNPGIGGTWMCRELVVPYRDRADHAALDKITETADGYRSRGGA